MLVRSATSIDEDPIRRIVVGLPPPWLQPSENYLEWKRRHTVIVASPDEHAPIRGVAWVALDYTADLICEAGTAFMGVHGGRPPEIYYRGILTRIRAIARELHATSVTIDGRPCKLTNRRVGVVGATTRSFSSHDGSRR